MTTSNMSLNEPTVGTTAGPTWATETNTNWTSIDAHDHTSGKGVQLNPSSLNINSDLEFNQNSASELKNVIFDSSVSAASTNYSVYQASGNLYWRNNSGTAVQITDGSAVKTTGGSISGMSSTAVVLFSSNSYAFKFDVSASAGMNYDGIAKMSFSDIDLYKYDAAGSLAKVTLKFLGSGTSAALTVPDETGTLLSTATSFAGAINIDATGGSGSITLDAATSVSVEADTTITLDAATDINLDSDTGLSLTSGGDIDLTATSDVNIPAQVGLTFGADKEKIEADASNNVTLSAAGDIILDADGADVTLKDGGTTFAVLKQVSGDLVIQPTTSKQIILNEDGGTAALTIDTSGNAEFPVSVKTDTISEKTSTTGVTIDGTLIKDNSIKPASGQSLVLQEDGGAAALTVDTSGDIAFSGTLNLADGVEASPATGDIWFADGQFHFASDWDLLTGVWATGGNLSTARRYLVGAGTQSAGLCIGGYTDSVSVVTEEYSGTSWSSGGNLSTARYGLAGAGTQRAGLCMGGTTGSNSVVTEAYNGTSWSSGGNLSTARCYLAGAGTQSAGLCMGGDTGSVSVVTEAYNGTSWSSGGNLSTARYGLAGAGTQSAGLCMGGDTGSVSVVTEEYNGTSWSSGGNLSTARRYLAGAGTQSAGLCMGGYTASASPTTEEYNGTSWTSGGNLSTARSGLAGAGTQSAGLCMGGTTGSNTTVTEEYTKPNIINPVEV